MSTIKNISFEWNRRGSSEARSEFVYRVCEWALLVKSVSKLNLHVDLICQNIHLVSYRQVPGSIPGRGSIDYFSFFPQFSLFFDSVPLLFHSNFQSWQMRSLPTLDPYVFFKAISRQNKERMGSAGSLFFGAGGAKNYKYRKWVFFIGESQWYDRLQTSWMSIWETRKLLTIKGNDPSLLWWISLPPPLLVSMMDDLHDSQTLLWFSIASIMWCIPDAFIALVCVIFLCSDSSWLSPTVSLMALASRNFFSTLCFSSWSYFLPQLGKQTFLMVLIHFPASSSNGRCNKGSENYSSLIQATKHSVWKYIKKSHFASFEVTWGHGCHCHLKLLSQIEVIWGY